jgi:hypothetical protein
LLLQSFPKSFPFYWFVQYGYQLRAVSTGDIDKMMMEIALLLFSNLAGVKILAAQEDHIPFSVTTGLDIRNPEIWNEFWAFGVIILAGSWFKLS